MVTNIHHVGIAVQSLKQAYRFWRDTLGLPLAREAEVAEQGVRAALLSAGDSHASQGDSELCGTAIECSLTGTFQLLLH